MEKLDILNRDAFVEQVLHLMENISNNKSSTCFAINGPWGCGKSFVLDMLEEQLNLIQSEETFTDRYFVIRYNCWKFDYYEEPLVAIVATMLTAIEEKTKLFPDSQEKQEILGMIKATGVALLSMANTAIKDKTGIDIQSAYQIVRNGEIDGAANYEKAHEYDVYFGFNKVVAELRSVLQDLAQDYTVVLLVDELDRCLPEYAIKVLERLHHLTEESANIITVAAIDKEQLQSSVKQIFGFEQPEKYLDKFFSFGIQLDYGTVTEKITEKYADYIALFDKDIVPFVEPIEECVQAIFKNIDIRTQEYLLEKATLAHKLLFSDKRDYSFMCMELLLCVMICVYEDETCFNGSHVNGNKIEEIFFLSRKGDQPSFGEHFQAKVGELYFATHQRFSDEPYAYQLPNKEPHLYAAIAWIWYWMHEKHPQYLIQHIQKDVYAPISNTPKELKKFAETIKMIK